MSNHIEVSLENFRNQANDIRHSIGDPARTADILVALQNMQYMFMEVNGDFVEKLKDDDSCHANTGYAKETNDIS